MWVATWCPVDMRISLRQSYHETREYQQRDDSEKGAQHEVFLFHIIACEYASKYSVELER